MLPDGKTTFARYLQQGHEVTVIGTALVDYYPDPDEVRDNREALRRGEPVEVITEHSKVPRAKLGGFRENEVVTMLAGQSVRVRRDLAGRMLVVVDDEGQPLELATVAYAESVG